MKFSIDLLRRIGFSQSHPYSVSIKNIGEKKEHVSLFDKDQLFDPQTRNKNLVIESTIPGVSYTEMCIYLLTHQCVIGSMMIYGAQVQDDDIGSRWQWTIHSKTGFGLQITVPIFIKKDIYQFQTDVRYVPVEFELQALSTIKFWLEAHTDVSIFMFPCQESSLENGQLIVNRYYSDKFSGHIADMHVPFVENCIKESFRQKRPLMVGYPRLSADVPLENKPKEPVPGHIEMTDEDLRNHTEQPGGCQEERTAVSTYVSPNPLPGEVNFKSEQERLQPAGVLLNPNNNITSDETETLFDDLLTDRKFVVAKNKKTNVIKVKRKSPVKKGAKKKKAVKQK